MTTLQWRHDGVSGAIATDSGEPTWAPGALRRSVPGLQSEVDGAVCMQAGGVEERDFGVA